MAERKSANSGWGVLTVLRVDSVKRGGEGEGGDTDKWIRVDAKNECSFANLPPQSLSREDEQAMNALDDNDDNDGDNDDNGNNDDDNDNDDGNDDEEMVWGQVRDAEWWPKERESEGSTNKILWAFRLWWRNDRFRGLVGKDIRVNVRCRGIIMA